MHAGPKAKVAASAALKATSNASRHLYNKAVSLLESEKDTSELSRSSSTVLASRRTFYRDGFEDTHNTGLLQRQL